MRKNLFISSLLLTVALASSLSASININVDTAKRCVAFLYPALPTGDVDTRNPDATAFFVRIPLKTSPSKVYIVLVTARHVFDPEWAHCPVTNPTMMYMRLNTAHYDSQHDETGVEYAPIQLRENGKALFATNGDDNADVAILPLMPSTIDLAKYDVASLAPTDFGSPDEVKQLAIGDEIVSAGLLPVYTGVKRNYPVFKFGRISDIPDEPVPVQCNPQSVSRPLNVWLIAANLVPGNSGSPIFFLPSGANGASFGGRAFLLGLQSESVLGADVAGMTPVKYIYETIRQMSLPDADLSLVIQPAKPK